MPARGLITPQRANLLEQIRQNVRIGGGFEAHPCFLGIRTMLDSQGDLQAAKFASRAISMLLTEYLERMHFEWLTDTVGLGFVTGMDQDGLKQVAAEFAERCQLKLTVNGHPHTISPRTVCVWYPSTLEASPRLLLDTAEHVLAHTDDSFRLVIISSPEDVVEHVGRWVNLLDSLGLAQKTDLSNRRLQRRVPLQAPCVLRCFRGASKETDALEAVTQDVSTGGFGVTIPRELHAGEIVEIAIRKPDGVLFVAGKVAYCRCIGVRNYLIGITALVSAPKPIVSADPDLAAKTYPWFAEYLRSHATAYH